LPSPFASTFFRSFMTAGYPDAARHLQRVQDKDAAGNPSLRKELADPSSLCPSATDRSAAA